MIDPESVIRLNSSITSRWRALISRFLVVWVIGLPGTILTHLFYRVRVVNSSMRPRMILPGTRLPFGPHAILALQHYYEWDPPLPFFMVLWPYTLLRPVLQPQITAGDFWCRNRRMRAVAWACKILCFVPDHEPERGAMRILADLFAKKPNFLAVIYPTGPIGRRKRFVIQRGIGWLAVERPDVPVIPFVLRGVQDLKLRDILLFRRPMLTLVEGKAIYGRDIPGATRHERENAVCEEIARQWKANETA